jgi:hypothetical protein
MPSPPGSDVYVAQSVLWWQLGHLRHINELLTLLFLLLKVDGGVIVRLVGWLVTYSGILVPSSILDEASTVLMPMSKLSSQSHPHSPFRHAVVACYY